MPVWTRLAEIVPGQDPQDDQPMLIPATAWLFLSTRSAIRALKKRVELGKLTRKRILDLV